MYFNCNANNLCCHAANFQSTLLDSKKNVNTKYILTNKITKQIMKSISTLIILFMATQLLVAQEKSMQQFIAKDKAVFVTTLSPYTTYSKLNDATKDKYNVSEMLAPMLLGMAGGDMSEENVKKVKEDLSDTKKAGLDTKQDIHIWAQRPAEMSEDDPDALLFNLVIPVTDGNKLRSFLEQLFGADQIKSMIPKGDALNMVHNGMLINWNKQRLIITASSSEKSFFEEREEFNKRMSDMYMEHATALGAVTVESSIIKDMDYQNQVKKEADFSFWMDYNNVLPPLAQVPMQARELVGSLYELIGGMKLSGHAYAKDGVGQFSTTMYANEPMTRVFNQSYDLRINKNFFKYVDNTNLMGMYSLAMNPKGFMDSYGSEVYKALKKSKEGTLVTNMLDIIDIFIDEDEIYTLLKGDVMFAVTDIQIMDRKSSDFEYDEGSDKWEEITTTIKEPMPLAVMMFSYGSEENIMKFIDLGSNASLLSKRADGVWAVAGVKEEIGVDLFIIVKDGVLMFTNDENITKNLGGLPKNKQMSAKDIKDISSYIQYGFLDASKMVATSKKTMKEMGQTFPEELAVVEENLSKFEIKTYAPEGNKVKTDMYLRFKDKDANALQIMVDGVLKIMEQKKSSRNDEPVYDEEEVEEEEGTKKL